MFMSQPPSFAHPKYPCYVCQLPKSLYGLKHASRAWYEEFSSSVITQGFTYSKADTSLFIYNSNSILTYILVYVDDILINSNSTSHISPIIQTLGNRFPLKDLGYSSYFLGLQLHKDKTSIFLHQINYASNLLTKFDLLNCKPIATLVSTSTHLSSHEGDLLDDPTQFWSMVRGLQYLTWTRPDISFAVHQVSQCMHKPRLPYLQVVKRILRYIKGTLIHGLGFKQYHCNVGAYSNAY